MLHTWGGVAKRAALGAGDLHLEAGGPGKGESSREGFPQVVTPESGFAI